MIAKFLLGLVKPFLTLWAARRSGVNAERARSTERDVRRADKVSQAVAESRRQEADTERGWRD